jgi:hypothetical protein
MRTIPLICISKGSRLLEDKILAENNPHYNGVIYIVHMQQPYLPLEVEGWRNTPPQSTYKSHVGLGKSRSFRRG